MFLVRFTPNGAGVTVVPNDAPVPEVAVAVRKIEDLKTLSTSELVVLRNSLYPDRIITKFSTRAIGIKSVWSYLQDWENGAAPNGTPVKKAPSSSSRIVGTARIVKLVKDNPRREGTNGHQSWQVTRDGMSVEQYVAAGGRLDDLRWNVKHGWLRLD